MIDKKRKHDTVYIINKAYSKLLENDMDFVKFVNENKMLSIEQIIVKYDLANNKISHYMW